MLVPMRPTALYADALRHMRARQLLHRARRLVPARVLAAGLRDRSPTGWHPLAAGLGVDPAPQSGPPADPARTGAFDALGRTRAFADTAEFWQPGQDGLLFAFGLHAFGELARYAAGPEEPEHDAFWARVLESWLARHDRPDEPAWHPYPTSGRVIAWCAALSRGGWPPALQSRMLGSLTRQAALLRRCVEHDIGGNHVLRNATALLIAGVCLDERAHERQALRLLDRELAAQVLADGGHEERSTAYHRAVLADLGDARTLLQRAGRPVPERLARALESMRDWESALRGPDGALPLLNDAWEGPAVAVAREDATTVLWPSGYVVLRHGADQAVLDVGPPAPAHLPPHAHADLLSFVLWADGLRLIVDPGSYAYTGPARRRFRATASHNTVAVDGTDQFELWGDFRAAFMPQVARPQVRTDGDVTVVTQHHDGYGRLPDPVTHERTFVWLPGDGLVIIDVLRCAQAHVAGSRLHLAPGISGAGGRIGPLAVRALREDTQVSVVAGEYAPYLGACQAIDVLEQKLRAEPGALFGWALLRDGTQASLDGGLLRVQRAVGERFELDLI
jgi:hypothetical protein